MPNIFGELPILSLQGPIRAHSLQTLKLLQIAILRMTHVHTLQNHFWPCFTCNWPDSRILQSSPSISYSQFNDYGSRLLCLEGIRTTTDDGLIDAGGLSFAGLRSFRFRRLRYLAEEEINRSRCAGSRMAESRMADLESRTCKSSPENTWSNHRHLVRIIPGPLEICAECTAGYLG